jgi:complement component 1 Q subcomponent-binding protein, mitochondrial
LRAYLINSHKRSKYHSFNFDCFPTGEKELVEFLTEEIVAEKKARTPKPIPSELDGFKVKLDGAEVELHKSNDKEK